MKEMMLSALKGKKVPHLPFVPRMDIWYYANRYHNTLPERYQSWSLRDILDDLGFGFHAIIPDFSAGTQHLHYGLGFYDFRTMPYRIKIHNVKIDYEIRGGEVRMAYTTPYGTITTRQIFDETVRSSGATAPHQAEYAIKTAADLKAAGYIFNNAEVVPYYEGYEELRALVGDRGIATVFHSPGASPMHYILRVLMRLDDFYYLLSDDEAALEDFADKVKRVYDDTFDAAANSSAELVMSGLNLNSVIIPPAIFSKYLSNPIRERAKKLEARGKLLATHPDGENSGLLGEYISSGMHVADSICPAPMTRLSLKEIRDAFGEKIAIIGGVPSVALLANSMSEAEFEHYIEELLASLNGCKKLVLSIADTTPPDAELSRLKIILKKSQEVMVP